MRGKTIRILCAFFILAMNAQAQCPEGPVIWKRIIWLRDSSNVPLQEQLKELEPILAKWDQGKCREDSVKGLLLQRIGALHFLPGDFKGGIEYTWKAIHLIDKDPTNPAVNPGHMVKSYNNLRICYDSLGMYEARDAAIDSCIAVMIRLRYGLGFGLPLLSEKVRSFYEAGDYYRCMEYCDLAERFMRSTDMVTREVYQYVIWKSDVLHDFGRFRETEGPLLSTLRELRAMNDEPYRGAIFSLLTRVYAETGERAAAVSAADSSVHFNKKTGQLLNCASTLNNVGYFLFFRKFRDLHTALSYHLRALAYSDRVEAMNGHDYMANEFSEMGLHDSAMVHFQLAFDQLRKGADEGLLLDHSVTAFTDRNSAEYVADLIMDKGAAYLRLYKDKHRLSDLETAKRIFHHADLIFEKLRFEQTEVMSRLFWRKNTRRLYAQALEACYLTGDVDGAFYFMERSRAALLLDQLREQSLLGPEELRAQAAVRRRINEIEYGLQGLPDGSPEYQAQKERLVQEKMNLEALRRRNLANSVSWRRLHVDPSGAGIGGLRRSVLDGRTIWVELFNTDTALYALYVGATHQDLRKIDGLRYQALTKEYLGHIMHQYATVSDHDAFIRTASALYDTLFGQLKFPYGRIIVSNDGQGMPFESLLTGKDPGRPEYLIEKAAVSYAFSATYLTGSAAMKTDGKVGDILGLAPVSFPTRFDLPELSGSDASLEKIMGMFRDGLSLNGQNASRAAFFRDYPRYRIAQLYTHGVDSSAFDEPLIYLADSAVLLSDLVLQQVPATRLVVLSACWTGTGELHPGEGVFSFGRGFAALGIPSSLTNLWSVENQATYKITESFYHYLSEGWALDAALQKAKLDFLNSEPAERRQPNYWAALVLSGRTDPIPVSAPIHWPYWIAGMVIAFSAILFLIARRKPRET